jgi:DNA-binding NarL/FixJ family response regulator
MLPSGAAKGKCAVLNCFQVVADWSKTCVLVEILVVPQDTRAGPTGGVSRASLTLARPNKARIMTRELTVRERQIVGLIRFGRVNKEIARELQLTEATVKEYLHRIFQKVEVKNRTELAIWALTNRIVA